MNIAQDIDDIIIHQLKLHWTTTEDLTEHVSEKLYIKYPDSTITIPGVQARLESLQEQLQIQQTEMYGKQVWMVSGDSATIPNRIWNVITSLAKLECHIQSIIYTIRKQHPSITSSEIKNAIGILQSSRIIQVDNKIASVTAQEKQFLLEVGQ